MFKLSPGGFWKIDWAQAVSLIAAISIINLAATKKLALYVHPRFIWFGVLMSVLFIFAFISNTHQHTVPPKKASQKLYALALCIVCVFMILSKPQSLSSSTALTRSVNKGTGRIEKGSLETLQRFGGDMSQLSIKEWSSILSNIDTPDFVDGKVFAGLGFITKDENNDPNIFYISRFVLTCCAVDARPIGVAVYYPNWEQTFKNDQWVSVNGSFTVLQNNKIAVTPTSIDISEEPERPYEY